MFDKLGQLASLMKNAGKIQQTMQEMQARLAAARFSADAGGGQVTATVDGRGELVALKITPQLTQSGDAEMLEDLVDAAVRQATELSREGAQKEMMQATGGLNLPGMSDLLGGLPR